MAMGSHDRLGRTTAVNALDDLLQRSGEQPVLALAPMQDVTDLAFMHLIDEHGGPDLFFTEYFRVHSTSTLYPAILRSITENQTGKPIAAQLIGNDIEAMIQTAEQLAEYPIAAIDLNLGCPAPIVYKKCAGGGLLADLPRVARIVSALRKAIPGRFTVKTRVGFDSVDTFSELLSILDQSGVDLVSVHGRTVKEGYKSDVHYDLIAEAVDRLRCPVLANGNVDSIDQARNVMTQTGAKGLMIGRGAIRNPWLFRQIREEFAQQPVFVPTGRDVLDYIRQLYDAVRPAEKNDFVHVRKMKRYLNFIGLGVEPSEAFLYAIRRAQSSEDFFRVCKDYLEHEDPMRLSITPTLAA